MVLLPMGVMCCDCNHLYTIIILIVYTLHTANCGVPLVDRSVMLNYSSTLEGSVLINIDLWNEISNMNATDEQVLKVTYHSNGHWIPDPAQFPCSLSTTPLSGIVHSVHMRIVDP